MIFWRVEVHLHTWLPRRVLSAGTLPPPSPPPPHSFHTWHIDKLAPHIHFIKMKTQSIQWAGNWKSFSLGLLRVVQSLPADCRKGPGCSGHLYSRRLPFLSPCSPISPLWSTSVYLLTLDLFFHSHNIRSTYRIYFFHSSGGLGPTLAWETDLNKYFLIC